VIACRACEPTHNRDVRERGSCGCSCHRRLAMTAPIDETHRDSVAAIRMIRRDVAAARERVARWEPTDYDGGDAA